MVSLFPGLRRAVPSPALRQSGIFPGKWHKKVAGQSGKTSGEVNGRRCAGQRFIPHNAFLAWVR
jgi:hypothetical protein